MYLHEAKDKPELIAEYLQRFNHTGTAYADLFQTGSEDEEKYEVCWQAIIALSAAFESLLHKLGWSFPGGDSLGLFCSSYHALAAAKPDDEEAVLDALVDIKRFAHQIKDLIAEGKDG